MNFKKWLKRIAAGTLTLILLLLFWGTVIEPRLIDERRHGVPIPNLPPTFDGAEIAVIADFQVGMWGANTGTIERIVGRLVEDRPAAVLIAGDFVYKADDQLEETVARAVALVRPLTDARIATFAVLGNHDYSLDLKDDPINRRVAKVLESALEQIGVHVLENEALPLRSRAAGEHEPLYIVGIGELWAGASEPREAVAPLPSDAARIVFMHHPQSFDGLPPGTAPLAVAAHTHGGQIALPFTPHWSWMSLVKGQLLEADGWAENSEEPPGNRLYVNIGIGFSDVPVRINALPELTLFTLRRVDELGNRVN